MAAVGVAVAGTAGAGTAELASGVTYSADPLAGKEVSANVSSRTAYS